MEKIKIRVDITKAQIDAIHKKLLVFIGVGAGSWIYVLEFAKSDSIAINLLAVLFFVVFIFSAIGTVLNLFKISKSESRLSELEKELDNVL